MNGMVGGNDAFWTFDAVQERLIEAYSFLGRLPDRERGWLKHGTMSLWRLASDTAGMSEAEKMDYWRYRGTEPGPMPGLTRDEVERMEATLRWLEWVPKGEPRRIVGIAVAQLASGRRTRVQWASLVTDPTVDGATDRMRMAYGRALCRIANRLNAAS